MEENNNLTMERMAPPPSGGKCGSRDPRLGLHEKNNRKGVHPVEEFIFKTNRTGNNRNETQEIKKSLYAFTTFFFFFKVFIFN